MSQYEEIDNPGYNSGINLDASVHDIRKNAKIKVKCRRIGIALIFPTCTDMLYAFIIVTVVYLLFKTVSKTFNLSQN